MGIIDNIKKIINPDAIIGLGLKYKEGVLLEEDASDAKLKEVAIQGLDLKQTFAFKLDLPGKRISQYLNPSTVYINKGCDGIIFTVLNNEFYIFACELKSSKPNETELVRKFRNSSLFINFIISILQEFYSFKDNFKIKYILFDTKNKAGKFLNKIQSERISGDSKWLDIYKIHRHPKDDPFNIRRLEL